MKIVLSLEQELKLGNLDARMFFCQYRIDLGPRSKETNSPNSELTQKPFSTDFRFFKISPCRGQLIMFSPYNRKLLKGKG